ncbi:glycine betaine ABC transporter substrate-binding protein [Halorhodospira neutriphila]|uniref:ABC-type glycine betaine transport system substrate-binding domain-containing protein n=1 Tax=Halorhodospira neutriphila TaxID=168379 RepID=A0ABS1E436_9GAMM|nr:glycine betaine ABC transporter substrate-binding protein [Halorhodospira neutriphila]MBK1725907.1 hypothetical protein [Halorhodospira neutriphila]
MARGRLPSPTPRLAPFALAGGLALAALGPLGCAPEEDGGERRGAGSGGQEADPVEIVYVEWDSEIASTHVVEAVIEERLGQEAETVAVTLTALWESIAAGDMDATVAAWLPSLQADQRREYGDQVEILGPHLEGTRIGLVVPAYVPIDSITELPGHAERLDRQIIGIEPDAGIMGKAEQALEAYGLEQFRLISGSDSTMSTVLGKAIRERRWIVVTGWTPHWKFARWDLKYLDDPRNVFGGTERISTVVRQGLKADRPQVYAFLERFSWKASDMEEVMLLMQQDGTTPEEAARRWIERHPETVGQWLP